MKSLKKPTPKVYKFIDGCPTEKSRLNSSPDLINHLFHTKEGDSFELEPSITLFPIETPGHLSDHLCFLMKESELAARGGTRKPFRRATRQRRPMDVHVFVSLRLRLGFGHQGNPNFTFGKPHDQKFKKNRPPLPNANLFLLRRFI